MIARVAHASRVLAMAPRHRGLGLRGRARKVGFGETPKPARGPRALPGKIPRPLA